MIDLETGRFSFGEGKELYPGMKLEDFKQSVLYERELRHEWRKTDENEVFYSLKPQVIDGFEMYMRLHFSSHDDFLEDIIIEKENWEVDEGKPTDKKIGRGNNYEYEYSVLSYLHEFLANQLEGAVEDGRELSFDRDWGTLKTTFLPYGATASPAGIKLIISYDTFLFKPDDGDTRTFKQIMGWE